MDVGSSREACSGEGSPRSDGCAGFVGAARKSLALSLPLLDRSDDLFYNNGTDFRKQDKIIDFRTGV